MSISKDAQVHYQKAIAYKNESKPAAALTEIRAAIAIEGRTWDEAQNVRTCATYSKCNK